jgi:hypothetical protein
MRILFKGTPGLPEYRGWHDGRFVHVTAGGVIEVNDAAGAALLLRDFPGIFVQELEAPPVDKMIRKARTK